MKTDEFYIPYQVDFLGDPLPEGYKAWQCYQCTAVCNFEAMQMCNKQFDAKAVCGFYLEQPESNGGCFGFMKKL